MAEQTLEELRAELQAKWPTFAEVNARPRATPKHQLATKLDRKVAQAKADLADKRKLAAWATAVKDRDEWKDRKTEKTVRRTHILAPDSAHAHHIEPRDNADTRYDVRNGITLSFTTHDAVERNHLRIVGTKFFTKNGRRYIDATHSVRWKEIG